MKETIEAKVDETLHPCWTGGARLGKEAGGLGERAPGLAGRGEFLAPPPTQSAGRGGLAVLHWADGPVQAPRACQAGCVRDVIPPWMEKIQHFSIGLGLIYGLIYRMFCFHYMNYITIYTQVRS